MPLAATAPSTSSGSALFLVLFALFYFVPTVVAVARRKEIPNVGSIVVINVFLGWTLVGWVVALAMAVRSRPQPQYMVPPPWQPQMPPPQWPQSQPPQWPQAGPPQSNQPIPPQSEPPGPSMPPQWQPPAQ